MDKSWAVPGQRPVMTIPDSELADLKHRLAVTRWPAEWPGARQRGWAAGVPLTELRRIAEVWRDGYDWRRAEAQINALPWATANLDGAEVRYLRFEGESSRNLPLILTNGWPSSFWELTGLARRLAEPTRWGGDARDAFTVIIPCLPGFPMARQQRELPGAAPVHELWHRLMRDELGLARYGAHGGDLGAGVTSLLGQQYPEAVAGIHLLSIAEPRSYDPGSVTPEEQRHLDALARWFAEEGAYEHQQMTRPMTLGYGLSDSPAGLLAWMLEKYWAWSDHGGRLSSVFSDDDILTQASLYWFTNCIGTSFRPYWEFGAGLAARVEQVEVPTAIAVFPKDLVQPPRSWAARTYRVTRYTRMRRGGHFAPHEQPGLLADDLAAFFRDLSL
jgi:pimeloyl-ACP methyl ester carboxylesterase